MPRKIDTTPKETKKTPLFLHVPDDIQHRLEIAVAEEKRKRGSRSVSKSLLAAEALESYLKSNGY